MASIREILTTEKLMLKLVHKIGLSKNERDLSFDIASVRASRIGKKPLVYTSLAEVVFALRASERLS